MTRRREGDEHQRRWQMACGEERRSRYSGSLQRGPTAQTAFTSSRLEIALCTPPSLHPVASVPSARMHYVISSAKDDACIYMQIAEVGRERDARQCSQGALPNLHEHRVMRGQYSAATEDLPVGRRRRLEPIPAQLIEHKSKIGPPGYMHCSRLLF